MDIKEAKCRYNLIKDNLAIGIAKMAETFDKGGTAEDFNKYFDYVSKDINLMNNLFTRILERQSGLEEKLYKRGNIQTVCQLHRKTRVKE